MFMCTPLALCLKTKIVVKRIVLPLEEQCNDRYKYPPTHTTHTRAHTTLIALHFMLTAPHPHAICAYNAAYYCIVSWYSKASDNFPHPVRFFGNARTLIGCAEGVPTPLRREVGVAHQRPLEAGSEVPLPLHADVRHCDDLR